MLVFSYHPCYWCKGRWKFCRQINLRFYCLCWLFFLGFSKHKLSERIDNCSSQLEWTSAVASVHSFWELQCIVNSLPQIWKARDLFALDVFSAHAKFASVWRMALKVAARQSVRRKWGLIICTLQCLSTKLMCRERPVSKAWTAPRLRPPLPPADLTQKGLNGPPGRHVGFLMRFFQDGGGGHPGLRPRQPPKNPIWRGGLFRP